MNNYTAYCARKNSFFTVLGALLMLLSAAARIVGAFCAEISGVMVVAVRILLPIAANLIFAMALHLRGEKQFYVTRVPAALLAISFACCIFSMQLPFATTAICLVFCILQAVLYCITCRGLFKTKLWVLLSWLVPLAFAVLLPRNAFTKGLPALAAENPVQAAAEGLSVLGILSALLAAKALPPAKEGEYRMRPGDRPDGRLIRTGDPMMRIQGYVMPYRNGASNAISDKIEITALERYIHQKRKDGLRHFGITHVLIAAYVRAVAELPGINRYFAGQKLFSRSGVIVSMIVKREMVLEAPETLLKVRFEVTDTAADVYRRYDETLQKLRQQDEGGFEGLVKVLNFIPGLFLKFVVWCITVLDYFGFCPKAIEDFSPFHSSMFITSMGSLGIPPIVHHLYNFGNTPVFCAFGAKRSVHELDDNGNVVSRKYLDYTWNTDERIVDGHYYASMLKKIRVLLAHPERLDTAPEKVVNDID